MSEQEEFLGTLHQFLQVFMRRSMGNFMRYAKEEGLSMSQIGALFQIHRKENCGVTDIGENLGVTSAAASQMLDRLVQQKLIDRSEDPNDRRGKVLTLTDKGRLLIQGAIDARQGWASQLDELLTEEEKQQVTAALQVLIQKTLQNSLVDVSDNG